MLPRLRLAYILTSRPQKPVSDPRRHPHGRNQVGMTQRPIPVPREQLRDRLASGEISSLEATTRYLERIDRFDGRIGAFITVDADSALEQARKADPSLAAGKLLGSLHGLPIALKDNIDTAGLRTTVGSSFFADRIAEVDAEVALRLRQAGAVLLGKVTLHEFAFGATNDNAHFGRCRNPWDLNRVPGGSSGDRSRGGHSRICAAALGTDTGGSVRIPAALNGVSGLRPTTGRVSTRGSFATTWTFDTSDRSRAPSPTSPLLQVLAGYDSDDPRIDRHASRRIRAGNMDRSGRGPLLASPRNFFFDDVDADIVTRVPSGRETFEQLGAHLEDFEMPGADDALQSAGMMIRAEAFAIHQTRLRDRPEGFGDDVRRRLRQSKTITATDYAEHRQRTRQWRRTLENTFNSFDLILTPSTGTTAPPAGGEMIETTLRLAKLTYGWSAGGLPALSLPCGFSDAGLPIGLQLAASWFSERSLIRAEPRTKPSPTGTSASQPYPNQKRGIKLAERVPTRAGAALPNPAHANAARREGSRRPMLLPSRSLSDIGRASTAPVGCGRPRSSAILEEQAMGQPFSQRRTSNRSAAVVPLGEFW